MPSRRTTLTSLAAVLAAGASGLLWRRGHAAGPVAKFEIEKTDAEWRRILTPQQYDVLRKHGTEYAGSSPLDKVYTAGIYNCAGCDLQLFSSDTKYDSTTGWPSFWAPLDNAVGTTVDRTLWTERTEVHCRRCGGHLGHVFPDGPKPTGQRYCMNGVALKFVPKTEKAPS